MNTDQIVAETADWIFERLPATGGDVEFTRLELETRIQSAIEKAYSQGWHEGVRQCARKQEIEKSRAAHASEPYLKVLVRDPRLREDVRKDIQTYLAQMKPAHASEQGAEQIVDECFRNVMLAMTEETIEGQRDQVKAAIRFSLSQRPTPAT